MAKSLTYPEGKGREFMLRVTGGEDAYYSAYSSPNRWHFNSQGPFKWKVNSAGWVYVAKPAVLKVLGEKRFGWREYRVEKDGMIKQVGFKDFMTKEEAEKAFLALNAKFKTGDKAFVHWFSGEDEIVDVISYEPKGDYYIVRGEDGQLAHPKAYLLYPVKNSRARNASSSPFGFFVGEQVVIKKDPSKKKYRVKEITETGDIRLEGATPLFDASELDTANYAGAYRSTNSIVAKALNAGNYSEKQIIDAAMQTLESRLRSIPMPGYSGPTRNYLRLIYKPNTTPQGSFSGEISAEANITEETTFDEAKAGKFGVVVYTSLGRLAPRTKIFRSINEAVAFIKGQVMPKAAKFLSEGQAKRQSDMAAKRKEDSSRRAYEKYGAVSYSNSRACNAANAIVRKAMNAVARNGYVKLYAKAGGTATVYEGDKVEYDGKVYTAKALGSPRMDSATLVDDAGNKLVVKMKDYKLKALNAVAENATDHTGRTIKVGDRVTDVLDSDSRAYPLSFGVKVTKVLGDKVEITDKYGNRYTEEGYNLEIVGNAVANAGKAMISRVGSDWYYSWADGSKDGREGPFRSEEEARVSAKQDGFAVINAIVAKALNWGGGRRPSGDQSNTYSEGEVMAYFKRLKKVMPDESDSFLKSEATRLASQGREGKDEMEYIESEARRKASAKVALGKKLLNIVSACQGIMRQISSHLSKAKAVYSDIERNRPAGLPALGGGFKQGLQEVETYLKSLESLITPRNPSLTPFLNARAKVDPNQLDMYRKTAKEFSDKVGMLWQATQAIERQLNQAGTYTDYKWPTGQIMSVWGDLNDAAEGLWRSSGELALTSAELKRLQSESRWD